MSRTARDAGIARLYHYENFVPEYLADLLTERRVHCSNLGALNDPWDCRPWFADEALYDADAVDKLLDFFFASNPTAPVSEGQKRATRKEFQVNREYRRGILDRFSEGFLKMIPDRWRIYCLTPVPDSTLMWSHYADDHKGICLEFEVDDMLFGFAREVTYHLEYPKWTPHTLFTDGVPHVLLTKSDDWRYEREYRIIGFRPQAGIGSHPLFLEGDFLRIPGGAMKAVIVGCEADFDAVATVVRKTAPDVELKRAVRSRTRYRLEIESSVITPTQATSRPSAAS